MSSVITSWKTVLLALWLAAVALAAPQIAQAQTSDQSGTFITPFPEGDIYRLQVWGDGLASGLLDGLVESLSDDTRVQINRKSRNLASVWRGGDTDEDLKAIDNDLTRDSPHIIVVLQGLVDRQPWRPGGRRIAVGSDDWKAEYARRLDRVMRAFRRKSVAVYWVGHAIMRRQDVSEDAQMINEVIRERAYVNGLKFIDVYSSFADEGGNFSTSGPDITGKSRTLREYDGSDYTGAGYRKLAHFVERELKRDLAQARNERTIPLAGGEAEQKRIRPQKPAETANATPATSRPAGPTSATAHPSATEKAVARASNLSASTISASGDLRLDSSRITLKTSGAQGREESVTLDILRPAIPATVVAVVTRRESPDKNSQMGDSLMTEILGGLTVVTSVTPTSDSAIGDRRKVSPTNALYYRVLVKGERLPPKPGRSDDMTWPRQETLPAAKAEELPADSSPSRPDGLQGRPVPVRQGRSRG